MTQIAIDALMSALLKLNNPATANCDTAEEYQQAAIEARAFIEIALKDLESQSRG